MDPGNEITEWIREGAARVGSEEGGRKLAKRRRCSWELEESVEEGASFLPHTAEWVSPLCPYCFNDSRQHGFVLRKGILGNCMRSLGAFESQVEESSLLSSCH